MCAYNLTSFHMYLTVSVPSYMAHFECPHKEV